MAGETGPIDVSLAVAMVIAGFFAVSVYNSVEIVVWTLNSFKRHHLYSQSMIVSAVGIFVHSVAALLRFFALAPSLPMCVFIVLGWWAMVTGQSVVMYSRLHLVISDGRKIRCVRNMIITNFFLLHLPVSILFFGSNSTNPEPFLAAFDMYENIQLAGFTVQETIISGLYAWEVMYSLRPILEMKGAEGKKMIVHIFILFIVVVVLDATLMAAQYTDNFQIQTTYKPVVYSVKLKFEFAILNRLMAFTRLRVDTSGVTGTISRTTTGPGPYATAKERPERYDDEYEILELEFPERPSKTRASSRSLGSPIGTAL